MNDNPNLQELWKGQPAEPPDTKDLFARLAKLKRSQRNRIIGTQVLFVLTSVFLIGVWAWYKPEWITTSIGITLILAAMAVYGYAFGKLRPLIRDIGMARSNHEYLDGLRTFRSRQQVMHTKILNLYFIMLSAGLGLYMLEPTHQMPLLWASVTFLLTATWILFNWFYIRPRTIRRQQGRVDDLIRRFEFLIRQLEEKPGNGS